MIYPSVIDDLKALHARLLDEYKAAYEKHPVISEQEFAQRLHDFEMSLMRIEANVEHQMKENSE